MESVYVVTYLNISLFPCSENKKLFWKEVKKVRGREKSGDVRMRGENGDRGGDFDGGGGGGDGGGWDGWWW